MRRGHRAILGDADVNAPHPSDASPALAAVSNGHGQTRFKPESLRFSVVHLLVSWLIAAASVFFAAAVLPGTTTGSFGDAVIAAALIAVLNAILPPIVAALPLPFMVALGFILILGVDAAVLVLISHFSSRAIHVDGLGSALLAALVIAAATTALAVILGVVDDDVYSLRVIRRIARRTGGTLRSDVPGIVFLEIDGLALPVLERAIRDGHTPELARWYETGTHRLTEWETDLSSQTGASQAGILLGRNDDIPAFRWVEKATKKHMRCSKPADCAAIEQRLGTGDGLLSGGGASRGNLFSGGAEEMILTVSRVSAEKRANPGYRAFLANGFNVTRVVALFAWEVVLERVAAVEQRRRDVRPRGARGGKYALLRAALCVAIRELIVFGVLTDMMRGRPAVYATFSSYDEVAHHSGLERGDTLEALRKLDRQFAAIERARRYAPRPYKLVVLSDHGQTQGATFKQRNGYDLQEFVHRSLARGGVLRTADGDENDAAVGHVLAEAVGRSTDEDDPSIGGEHAVVLGSGNLGLIYLMEAERRLSSEEIDERHPQLLPHLREHPHIGFVLVHSRRHGPVVLGRSGARYLTEGRVDGDDPLAQYSHEAAAHLKRTDSFANAPDVLVNSFYDPRLEQGCAFEELISFHGGLGGPQTRAFILSPVELPIPAEPIVGAVQVHKLLVRWRRLLAWQSSENEVEVGGAALPGGRQARALVRGGDGEGEWADR